MTNPSRIIENHPITPPPTLVREWAQVNGEKDLERFWMRLATQASRWGADQQLNADCEWVQRYAECGDSLLAAMRPKSPRLAEDALKALQDQIDTSFKISSEAQKRANTIRTALIRLKELEQLND